MIIYLDESGCPGFNFTYPYRQGGSSRYFTIAGISLPDLSYVTDIENVHQSIYEKHRWNPASEKKSCNIKKGWQKRNIAVSIANLVNRKSEIGLHSITIYKPGMTVSAWIDDKNLMFNYMFKLLFLSKIIANNNVSLFYDERDMSVSSGKSLEAYIRQEIQRAGKSTTFSATPLKSHEHKPIIIVDYLAYLFFSKYQFQSDYHLPLASVIDDRPLYHH